MIINIRTRAWLILFIYIIIILSTLSIMPEVWRVLSINLGKSINAVPYILTALFFLGLSIYIFHYKQKKLYLFFWILLFFMVYFFLMKGLKFPAERIHFLEYGLLSYFAYKALERDLSKKKVYFFAFFTVILVCLLDEGIQYLLPNRVGDLQDVSLNIVSGVLGLTITGLIVKAEASEAA